MPKKDYYAILGVARRAAAADIKCAYRRLARRYHPDVSREPDAEARFKDVVEAFETLRDAGRRAAYDAAGTAPDGIDAFVFRDAVDALHAGPDPTAFFDAIFGPGGLQRAFMTRGADHRASLSIDLRDAYCGAQKTLVVRAPEAECDGSTAARTRRLLVDVPPGVRPGQVLRVTGYGGAGQGGGPAGDLLLDVAFEGDPHVRIEGADVVLDVPVAPWEAALGTTVTVSLPDGPAEIRVPARSRAGRRVRVKGRGLPGHPPGDLLAVLSIATHADGAAACARDAAPASRPRR